MSTVNATLQCPACIGTMAPKVYACGSCGAEVKGRFKLNEFANLGGDDLHFLRIFVRCEGRIRDMESALGLSYPTVRSRLTALRNKVAQAQAVPDEAATQDPSRRVLERLAAGEITFDEAMSTIKKGSNV